uniref:Prisilkin-39-like n=1 Tax=Glossina palpalis gambiensis TaxID=67801 RepID=A0A1B0B9Q1_9MUSC
MIFIFSNIFLLTLLCLTKAESSTTEDRSTTQELQQSGSDFYPLQGKYQLKRYVPGYSANGYSATYDGALNNYGSGYYSNPYSIKGYGWYGHIKHDYLGAYPGYSGYNMHSGYNSYPYNSYYNSRFGAYPYNRPGYGYHSYPSSYYSSSYANSIVGGGLGALGTPGYIPPPPAGGYHYNPGITGTVY